MELAEKMRLKEGEIVFLCGEWGKVRDLLYHLSVHMQNSRKKVLFIDTLNVLNPHSKIYKSHMQKEYILILIAFLIFLIELMLFDF